MAQGPGRPGPVPGAGRASAAPPAPLLRPHEIDQSPGQAGVAPRQKMQQARRDLEAGQVDTDLHATPGLDAERLKALVTPVKPPPDQVLPAAPASAPRPGSRPARSKR